MSTPPSKQPTPIKLTMPSYWQRHRTSIIAVCLLALMVMVGRSLRAKTSPLSDWEKYHNKTFQVSRVVDGDTLDIDIPDGKKSWTRIRLWGVDTPEMGRGSKKDMYFAKEATDFATKTLKDRTVHIVLSPKKTRGKYGRLLAYVYLERGGDMFNEMLLKQGFAYADLRFSHIYKKRFEQFEKHARDQKIGLWAKVTIDKMPKWRQRFIRRDKDK